MLHGLHSGIKLITLSESWLKPDRNDSEFEISGYTLFRKDRKGNNGGVAVYARNDLVVTRRDDLEVDSVEGLWLEIAMPKSRGFLVGSFYRPDRSSKYYDEDFIAKLNCILDTATADGKEILLFGDFNCCFMSAHRNNSECKQLKTLFKSLNFNQLINSPTRISKDSKSLIDLIAVNYPQNICDSGVVSANLSDHELVYCVRKINWRKAPAQFKTFRNYANYNPCDFRRDLEGVTWNSVSTRDGPPVGVNDLWADFKRAFVLISDRHAPVIQKRVRGVDNCSCLNRSIKLNMRQRDYFLRKARTTNHSEDWARYRCFRNRVTSDIKKAKAAYNRRLIDESGGDPKTFWKTIKKILQGEKRATSPNISVNGSVTSDKRCIANAFNTFFASAATRLMSVLNFSGVPNLRQLSAFTHRNPPFRFEAVSVAFVRAQLRRLKVLVFDFAGSP